MNYQNKLKNIYNKFQYNLNLYYYKYVKPNNVNHYNIINKLDKYIYLGSSYYKKYPNASSWINLNDKLFLNNPKAIEDYNNCANQQKQLHKQILLDLISSNDNNNNNNNNNNKNYTICSQQFKHFWIESSYHIGQYPQDLKKILIKDIIKHNY